MFFSRSHNVNPDMVLAFAGILQALNLVKKIAKGERKDKEALSTCISSIFTIDSLSLEEIYGNPKNLELGLSLIKKQMISKATKPDLELSRYLVTLLHIERKLVSNTKLMTLLQQEIVRTEANIPHFSLLHENIFASLANAYTLTISTLQPRIMIAGEQPLLSDVRISDQLRALLLAAMRSAVLWRQLGGSRLMLLFNRQRIVVEADRWLDKIRPDTEPHKYNLH